jgi:hypothetical protein
MQHAVNRMEKIFHEPVFHSESRSGRHAGNEKGARSGAPMSNRFSI